MDGWSCIAAVLVAIGCCSHKDWSALHRVCRPGTVITTSLWRRLLLPDAHFPAPCPRIWTQRRVQLFKNALCVTFDVISCASDALVWAKLFIFNVFFGFSLPPVSISSSFFCRAFRLYCFFSPFSEGRTQAAEVAASWWERGQRADSCPSAGRLIRSVCALH